MFQYVKCIELLLAQNLVIVNDLCALKKCVIWVLILVSGDYQLHQIDLQCTDLTSLVNFFYFF